MPLYGTTITAHRELSQVMQCVSCCAGLSCKAQLYSNGVTTEHIQSGFHFKVNCAFKRIFYNNITSLSTSCTCWRSQYTSALEVVLLGDLKRLCYTIWIKLSGKVVGVNRSSQHSVALRWMNTDYVHQISFAALLLHAVKKAAPLMVLEKLWWANWAFWNHWN